MQNLDRILSSARSDGRLQAIITNYLFRDGYPRNAVAGMSFKGQREDPPAFSLGFYFGIPWGAIYVSDNLYSVLSQEELEFVVLHEVAHIVKNHIVPSSIIIIGKSMIIDFLADLLEILFSNVYVTHAYWYFIVSKEANYRYNIACLS